MPEIKEDAFKSLLEAFQEVAFRANRLREWMELDRYLRSLERRFSEFDSEVRTTVGPPPNLAGGLSRISLMWTRCQETELMDLQTFADGSRHINRSSWNEQGNGAQANTSGMRVVSIADLIKVVGGLEQALTNQALLELSQQCNLFRKTLAAHVADRQHIVTIEVQEMCELTIRLRMQLQP
jgi:hypothetical protein